MTLDVVLFGLRMVSAIVLMVIVLTLFVLVWRDYQATALQTAHKRRTYGQLVSLIQVDNQFAPTGSTYALLPITSFGRSPTNTVVLNNTFASSEHALLALRNGQWWLEDRKSRNGTLLNGEKLTFPTIVTDGDIIGIGTYFFQIVLE